jgi:ribonuclease HI
VKASKNPVIREVKLFTDGGSRGNPGPGAIAFLIVDMENRELENGAETIGFCTNNQAEYRALIKGLDRCAAHTRGRVHCFLDSELVFRQVVGAYRLRNEVLRSLFQELKAKEAMFVEVRYTHVRRENPYMKKVDRMLNEALEGRA